MFSKKDLQRLIIPLVIEQFLAVTIGMADTVMVSGVGEAAVSGVSLVDSINILLINIFSALATGGAIVSSQYIGKEEPENACEAAKQLVQTVCALSVVIGALCVVLAPHILHLVFGNVESTVMSNAELYFFLSALSYPFIALYNAGAALFRAMGNSKVSMFISFIMNVINVSGNAILIFGFGFGVAGAGIASLTSRFVAAVIILTLLKKPESIIHIESYLKLDFKPRMVQNILKIGIPNGLENGMFQIGKILVAGLITTFGTAAIAANAVGNSIASAAIIPGSAIGLGLVTVVGQCVGAKRYDEARKYVIKLTKLAYLAMAVLNLVILAASPFIVRLYGLSPETTSIAIDIMVWHSIFCLIFWPAAFTLPNGLRAANDVKFTMTVSIISMWVCRIGMSYVLGKYLGMGVLGVWIAMFLDWICRVIAFVWRFQSNRWQNKQILS